MNVTRVLLVGCFVASLMPSSGCNDDGTTVVTDARGVVDEGALTQGVQVSVSGSVGSLEVAFSEPVPEVDDGEFQDEMSGAVSVIVASDANQASVDLNVGTALDDAGGTPAAPGEFTWVLDADRTSATLMFYNETPSGLTLTPGNGYSATFSVAPNDFVESVSAISFAVAVE